MKWLTVAVKLIVIAVILFVLTPTHTVLAASNEDTIQVVVVPNIGYGIISFTATVIGDSQVDLEWIYGEDIANVMVRAKYGSMPMSRTDGYLAYEGNELSSTDTSMDFDETLNILYYRIWAQHNEGYWFDYEVNSAETEGIAMYLFALLFLSLVLTFLAYHFHRGSLAMAGVLAWFITGAWAYVESSGEWGINMGLFFVCIGMFLTTAMEAVFLSRGAEQAQDEIEYTEAIDEAYKDMDSRIKSIHRDRFSI